MSDARTLVLIHAFPLGARMWAPQLSAFEGWRIITPSLPGFDGSAPGRATMEAFARRINGHLDRLEIEHAVFAGLSLGGYVTFAVIRQRPDRASALILADTRCGADSEEGRAGRLRLLGILDQKGPAGVFEDMRPKLFGETTHVGRPDVVAAAKEMAESQKPGAIEDSIRAMLDRPDCTPLLATIRVPTLIVVGEEDTLTPPAESERIQREIRGSTLVRIPGAGHLPNLEDPAAFNATVSIFLKSLH
jgi:3-oxoadipate enol-lactonase